MLKECSQAGKLDNKWGNKERKIWPQQELKTTKEERDFLIDPKMSEHKQKEYLR